MPNPNVDRDPGPKKTKKTKKAAKKK